MALEARLDLRLSQKLILTPQLQQAIKLLQLPQLELSQELNHELIENPFLEESFDEITTEEPTQEERDSTEAEDIQEDTEAPLEKLMNFTIDEYFDERGSDGRDLGYFNPGTVSPPSFDQFLFKGNDLYDHLLWQLRLSSEPEDIRRAGEIIIGNVDENGYLRVSLEELIDETKVDRETIEKSLTLIQSFDPPGVAARSVTECLLLQLTSLNLQGTLIEKIIINNMEDLEKKKYSRIAQQYNLPVDDVMAAVKIIEGLEPKPGRIFSNTSTNYVVPDIYIIKTADGFQIILNDDGLPRLRISTFYRKLIQQKNAFSREDKKFLIEKLRFAVGLLKSLDQRNKTIYRVTETILDLQKDFFDKGVECLKPLTLRDVSSKLNMHESTVSRVTSNKYLSCPHGVFSFKYFFSSALHSGLGSVSSTSVKNLIRKIITEENSKKPLSDQRIVEILKSSDIVVARRTVAKYREELKIPSQIYRKKK
ncbi:MAG: RNA polymerase factor sigma-54 [Nitrospirota bacterium]|nr:RNA polymerase factor sigma-54 [Nitrospirota bacterium]MDH5768416.1 RNA polymerase factor sigma-54 [Nitrospirota bacterium]